jgi:hypothetical protein
MISNRNALISKLSLGDMFHASFPNGATRICIVTSVNNMTLAARAITTQENFEFDRTFGRAKSLEDAVCTIDSVYRLSTETRDVLLEIDRRYGGEPGPDGLPLSSIERRELIDAGATFSSNPLPP